MRRTLSIGSESGVEETTIGPFSFKPRYCVEKSIIPHLRQPSPPVLLCLIFRFLRGSDVGRFAATGHRSPRGVNAPLALDIVLSFLEQFCGQLRIAARQHRVTSLP